MRNPFFKILILCIFLLANLSACFAPKKKTENSKETNSVNSAIDGNVFRILQQVASTSYNLKDYIKNNIKLSKGAKLPPDVVVEFVVKKNGEIAGVRIVKGADELSEKTKAKIIKVFANMPKWEPGKQNGKAVNSYVKIPLKHIIE